MESLQNVSAIEGRTHSVHLNDAFWQILPGRQSIGKTTFVTLCLGWLQGASFRILLDLFYDIKITSINLAKATYDYLDKLLITI